MHPLIAVTGRRRPPGPATVPPTVDMLESELYYTGYADHVLAAGGLAVHLPGRADPELVMDRCDALVLTGGTDVDPARYGAAPCATTPPLDPERDAAELALLDAALALGRPVLAICRGVQLVNVSRGGTLHAHLAEHVAAYPPGTRHDARIEPGTTLHRLFGPSTSVNSLHHQSIDRLGRDLVITARAPDGVVEGVELPGTDLLGVQWHPEHLRAPQPVFTWLVEAARERVGAS
jgi:putative glutamine amidotransferase